MKLYHPLLFIGLGGTGGTIGAVLERRLRAEICGPDGTGFQRKRPDATRYELPACAQFVYIDVNQADLDRLPERAVPDPRYAAATRATAHNIGLETYADSFPELARNLRLRMGPEVAGWLPGRSGEPHVSPLAKGAGQLPTIGRAVFFDTFSHGPAPVVAKLGAAIGRLSSAQAAADLSRMADGAAGDPAAVEVFVAFSIAGGTGAGIFYDALHLVAGLFARTSIKPKIHPLVLMPSAFPEGGGGGRSAELNAARAVLDLAQLVDRQNSGTPGGSLLSPGGHGPAADPTGLAPADDVSVSLPEMGRIEMRPGIAQTAYLFSRPPGVEPDDLRRSVVALILSLVGTELNDRTAADADQHQSFADSFLNSANERQIQAKDGIGDQGVSTALVASLTVPADELADMVAERLLTDGVEQLAVPLGAAEANRAPIERFFTYSGLHDLLTRPKEDFTEPEPTHGARNITIGLGDRAESMRAALARHRSRLDRSVPEQVDAFDPGDAVVRLLAEFDPFRVRRIVFGHDGLGSEAEREGAHGLMVRRREPPPAPKLDDGRDAIPTAPELRDRMGGFVSMRWNHELPAQARRDQDTWYQWQTRVQWTQPWSKLARSWQPKLDRTKATLSALIRELTERARRERENPRGRAERLHRYRGGVSYLLPAGGDLERFHRTAVQRLIAAGVAAGTLSTGAREGDLLNALLTPEGWREAFAELRVDGSQKAAERAVDALRKHLRNQIAASLRTHGPDHGPLLPRLADLLAEAAQGAGRLAEEELVPFRARLAGLVPPAFAPQGRGPLKVLVTYPAAAPDPATEEYLRRTIDLPTGETATYQFTATTTESISVVLFRTSMGITEVREVRELLRTWADAIDRPQPQDYLRWRQRTGHSFGHLATREEHRVQIAHRLLSALWNGRVTVDGDPASPISMTVRLTDEVGMTLDLQPLDRASSWGSVLRAYEVCAIADDTDLRRDFCARLMREVPEGVGTQPKPPDDLYRLLRVLAAEQITVIDRMLDGLHPSVRTRAVHMRDFWAHTVPAALEREFTEVMAIRRNLWELERAVAEREL
ncbi:tubulin-like doman-containing protein [Actinomadura rubrisoli]|uniref:Tubulin-like protein n=1 Tax=Actinomadura rubrisoli TaxID=2530368 RepID=A0A4R5CA27_9ACTN|nr:tubulin-like doman-containing protein [Actinomadura rubrisoli]TDD93934.1 hypothetical protein E1298_07910 [Actinomadura rubrisoli]